MTEEQLNAFLAKVMADTGLQQKLNEATSPEEFIAVAKSAGYSVTAEALSEATSNLSDSELEAAAGGGGNAEPIGITGWYTCGQKVGPTGWLACRH